MTDRSAEIALARSAAPGAISGNAEIMVLSPQGYDIAVQNTNGFVCLVQRSWIAPVDDPDFWNPKLRSPICLNPAGARSYLPIIIMRTRLILAGKSKVEMSRAIENALDKKELPLQEPGAMGYMMSKEGYLSDRDGHWHPHLMFFVPFTEAKSRGAGLSGSPIFGAEDPAERLTVFFVPIPKWSDGTPDSEGH